MPVEFLSDEEAAAYGRYVGAPTRAELEKMFFLDDADRKLIGRRRGDQHRLGFALQLTTARFVGRFLPDPLEVPAEVIDYLADQLGVADVSQVKQYTERRQTQFDHQDEIKKAYGLREFSALEAEFTAWVDARAWNTGDGKKSIFVDGVSWLRTNKVLLPGVTTLTRLIARVRDEATERLHDTLYGILSPRQQAILARLLEVPEGARASDLERWRKGPSVPSGRNMEKALERAGEILSVGLGAMELPPGVPHRRMVDLARYGMTATATTLRRHGPSRQLATLLATVIYLEGKSVDDCLDLLDLLMTTELIGKGRDRHRQGACPPAPQACSALGHARCGGGDAAGGHRVRRGAAAGAGVGGDRCDGAAPGTEGGGGRGDRDGAAARRRCRCRWGRCWPSGSRPCRGSSRR
ncbi:DUF4158 domain-containing protein [Microbispora sitophila]|uniref:DUF4158 domain-containing protein n=1 Tax=Microbispora sitophila TaxID=2771537 RepID=UPI001D02AED8|nr:DUF4158 domain-containing protein [Microbispora sitophila]